ncbi:hypothetical protein C2G38_2177393 [Gigaspora rosea]|uniref:Uncharacterized protein n=1 Tax=Gigaspora rosea TaxID=44941 RepID=A0A397VFB4_9GLOM|nr:hypothetical protein C2G38_2177393 [Gigaspora rosea]
MAILYILPALDLLDKKTSLFLLEYFQDLFYNCGKSGPKLKKKRQKLKVYHLATLEEDMNLRRLPTAYGSSYLLQPNLCDRCKYPFSEENKMVLICDHGYHLTCYNRNEDTLTLEDFVNNKNTKKEEEKKLQRK